MFDSNHARRLVELGLKAPGLPLEMCPEDSDLVDEMGRLGASRQPVNMKWWWLFRTEDTRKAGLRVLREWKRRHPAPDTAKPGWGSLPAVPDSKGRYIRQGGIMDKNKIAKELVAVAKSLTAVLGQDSLKHIGRLLGPGYRAVPKWSNETWLMFECGDGRDWKTAKNRVYREVERTLLEENVAFKSIDVREGGKSRYNLGSDLYMVIEAPQGGKFASVEMTAATLARERMENAKRMIEAGGRGIELGIREISYLARDMDELYKQMRRIQGGNLDDRALSVQTDLLEVLGRFM